MEEQKTGAEGRFYVTGHAIKRYRQRVRNVPRDQALRELVEMSSAATCLKTFEDGSSLWRGPNRAVAPRLLFLVGPTSEGDLPAIRTIPERRKHARSPTNHRARAQAKRRDARVASFASALGETST